jgi:hypothetical protein
MSNKERFMDYAKKRIRDKAYKNKKAQQDAYETSLEGFERCARGRWRAGQR